MTKDSSGSDQAPSKTELARELLRAADEERERLAREIHDELAQELFTLRLLAESVARASGPDVPVLAQRVAELAARVEQTARELARSYNPISEAGGNFAGAVRALTQRHTGRVAFDLTALPEVRLERCVAVHLHRIVQEAVTNAVRHGGASRIRITLRPGSPRWQLLVEDNGSGFDPGLTPDGLGLRTMAYRAAQIGGFLSVKKNGEGMQVVCEFQARPAA